LVESRKFFPILRVFGAPVKNPVIILSRSYQKLESLGYRAALLTHSAFFHRTPTFDRRIDTGKAIPR